MGPGVAAQVTTLPAAVCQSFYGTVTLDKLLNLLKPWSLQFAAKLEIVHFSEGWGDD